MRAPPRRSCAGRISFLRFSCHPTRGGGSCSSADPFVPSLDSCPAIFRKGTAMVVDFLKGKERRNWRIWLLALLCWSSGVLAGSSVVFAQPTNSSSLLGGHVSEEDLPPEEAHAPAPAAGEASSPSAPPAAKKTEATATV